MRVLSLMAAIALVLAAMAPASTERGPLISMELRDVEIREVMRAIGQEHNLNIIVDDSVAGSVTVSLREVPLWDALDSILYSKGYTYRVQPGGVILVEASRKAIRDETDIAVKEFRLSYLKLSDSVLSSINSMLTSKGKLTHVLSSNTVVVKDLPLGIERVAKLLKKIDLKPRQVMIEARIVEINTSYSRELGVVWGKTGYNDPNTAFGKPGNFESRFSVNLPIPSAGAGGDLVFGFAVSDYTLNLNLSALEDIGAGKIISRPKIMVTNNQQATITAGTEILIPTIVNATVGGVLKEQGEPKVLEAKLELAVTPRVVNDELISLAVTTKREEFDFASQIQGFPPKQSRTATTNLMVRNGQTIVIGGIFTKNKSTDESRVPLLHKIPILGWLFKKEVKQDIQTELMIFLTPTIVSEDFAESQEQWSQQTP